MGSKLKFYNAWFCPFGQRAWIGLLHKGVDFDYVEQDPYNKSAEWLAINPRGLVPAMIHNDQPIYESSVCLEYIEDYWPTDDPVKSLLPRDPYQRARARMWADYISKKLVPLVYKILMNTKPSELESLKENFLTNIIEFQEAMDERGPYFLGSHVCIVDIMMVPFAWRLTNIVKHYRDFEVPNSAKFQKYHSWYNAVKSLECFKATLCSEEALLQKYERYTDGSAQTQVAEAVRKGGVFP